MRRHHRDEAGFTLIEILVTLVILAILLAIAIPSYLSFRGRASDTSAQANIRAITPSIQSFYADNSTYVGMTLAGLKSTYDQALDTTKFSLPAGDLSASSFCISSTVVGQTWSKTGPAGTVVQAACP